jgi:ribosome-binding factor A
MPRRAARLNEQLKREISGVLRSAVRDPRVGNPTVTDVRASSDLSTARVFVRPDPAVERAGTSAERTKELLAGLAAAAPFVRRELGKLLEVRRVPELRFEIDQTFEHVLRIERILEEVRPRPTGEGEEAPE